MKTFNHVADAIAAGYVRDQPATISETAHTVIYLRSSKKRSYLEVWVDGHQTFQSSDLEFETLSFEKQPSHGGDAHSFLSMITPDSYADALNEARAHA